MFNKNIPFVTNKKSNTAVCALNMITVSVSQIVEYRDSIIMDQEYDAILNNINLQNIIPDETLLKTVKQILDVITFFRIQDKEKYFIEQEYQHNMKNAIWKAIPNIGYIIGGSQSGVPKGAQGGKATYAILAVNVAVQCGIAYMNYRNAKAEGKLQKEKALWELEESAIEQLNSLRRELFDTAWHLAHAYNFDDSLRLTENQIKQYNKVLTDEDPIRRYERLDAIKENFGAYPPFWYQFGHTAKEISDTYKDDKSISEKYTAEALNHLKKFQEMYIPLLREDPIYCAAMLEMIPFYLKENKKAEVKQLIAEAEKLSGNYLDVKQQIVLASIAAEEYTSAKNLLQFLVNENYNTAFNAQLLSKVFIRSNDRTAYKLLEDRVTLNTEYSVLFPFPEAGENEDEEFIKEQSSNLWRQFNIFYKKYIQFNNKKISNLNQESKMSSYSVDQYFEKYLMIMNESFTELINSGITDLIDFNIKEKIDDELNQVFLCNLYKGFEEEDHFYKTALWNDKDEKNPGGVIKTIFDCVYRKLMEKDASLGEFDMVVTTLFYKQCWPLPMETKKSEMEESISLFSQDKIGPEAEYGKKITQDSQKILAIIKNHLGEDKENILYNPKKINQFLGKYGIKYGQCDKRIPVAIITTKDKTAFLFFDNMLYYVSYGFNRFCNCYNWSNLDLCKISSEDKKLIIKQDPIKDIGNPRSKKSPIITADDIDITKLYDLLEELISLEKSGT